MMACRELGNERRGPISGCWRPPVETGSQPGCINNRQQSQAATALPGVCFLFVIEITDCLIYLGLCRAWDDSDSLIGKVESQ